ncbi:MAG: ribosome assembly cofactor RimP [Bacteroidota bacterium]
MLSEDVQQSLSQIIEGANPEAFVVEMKMNRGPSTKLLIKVDTDRGISMSECAELSRAVSAFIDENEDLFDFSFTLELTSPGVGSPLLLKRQYTNNIGRFLKVSFGEKEVKGKLEEVTETEIRMTPHRKKLSKSQLKKLEKKGETLPDEYIITFADIKEAKVIII